MMIRTVCILAAMLFAGSAFAQTPQPIAKIKPFRAQPQKERVRLEKAYDDVVLVSKRLNKRTLRNMQRMGFRKVRTKKEIAHRVILKGRAYFEYILAPSGPKASELRRSLGRTVELSLQQNRRGLATVLEVKR